MLTLPETRARRHPGDGLITVVLRPDGWSYDNPRNGRRRSGLTSLAAVAGALWRSLAKPGARLSVEQGRGLPTISVDPAHRRARLDAWLPWRVIGDVAVAAALPEMKAERLRDGRFAMSFRNQREALLAALRASGATGGDVVTLERRARGGRHV